MTPEEQAQNLAEWLEQNPGSPAPEDVDPQVVEAVYVLRPDLAPAPRVTVDSILERVEEGPYAAEKSPAARPVRPRMWAWRGLGGLAAAAAVLLIALPQQDELETIGPQGAPAALEHAPSEDPNPSDLDFDVAAPEPMSDPQEAAQLEEAPPPAEERTASPRPAPRRAVPPTAAAESVPPSPPPASEAEPEAIMDADTPAVGELMGGSVNNDAAALRVERGAGATDGALGAEESEDEGDVYSDEPESVLEPESMAADSLRSVQQAAPAAERKTGFPFLGRSRRSEEAPPAAAAPSAAPVAEDQALEEAQGAPPPELLDLKSRAYPQDYVSPAADSEASPQWSSADRSLLLLRQSRFSEAFSEAESALLLSDTNTAARSLLFWILGEVHLSRGSFDSAAAAYAQALELNNQR